MLKFITCFALALVLALASAVRADDLDKNFVSPPDSAKPRTWWHWITGNISKDGITKDLEAMKRIGVGGAQCFTVDQDPDPTTKGHVLYMSPEWQQLTQHAISECHRLGLELSITACEGWSESGGNWITPEQSMQKIVWSTKEVQGPMKIATTLPAPQSVRGYYRDIAVFAFPSLESDVNPPASKPTSTSTSKASTKRVSMKTVKPPSAPGRIPDLAAKSGIESHVLPDSPPTTQVAADQLIAPDKMIDLTSQLDDKGMLNWDAPEGRWTILRIGQTTTGVENHPTMPETRGLEVDKLSREHVKAFFDGALAKIADQAGKLAGSGWDYVLMDSWEAGCLNWTDQFRAEFQKRRGYDPLKYLPALTGRYVDTPEKTERFLWDYRRTIADLIAQNHYEYMHDLLKEHNIKLTAEAPGIGMPVVADELECKGKTDVPMGEFWVNWTGQGDANIGDSKEAASAAHIYGKTLAAAESFTSSPEFASWKNDPYSLKAQGDRMFCVGINRFVFHRYAHQPDDRKPGFTMGPWGINFERSNTWWEPGKAWITYLSRCEYLLQQGLFVGDLCYFYGEGAPRNLDPNRLSPKPPAGYDYDGCNTDVLMTRMTVKDGRIVLPDGMSYRVLVLHDTDRMSPAVLMKVAELVHAGATVVGKKPIAAPGLSDFPHCDDQVKTMANELWGDCDGKNVTHHAFGAGHVYWGKPLAVILASAGPDFEATSAPEGAEIKYIHRRTDDADIYFVSNQAPRYETIEATFRVEGKLPELFHADTGVIEPAPSWKGSDGKTTVPLRLDPFGSVFVIFRHQAAGWSPIVAVTRNGQHVFPASDAAAPPVGKLVVTKATYGVINDPAKSADLTKKVAAMVKGDMLSVTPNNELAGNDPAKLVHKQFRIEYTLDGKPMTRVIEENEHLDLPESFAVQPLPPAELCTKEGDVKLLVWEPGSYDIVDASAQYRRVTVDSIPATVDVTGPWKVAFPPKLGAPDSISLDKLMSWTESPDAGVRYFSGTATYTTEFKLSRDQLKDDRRLKLDLGNVKNLAEVTLNGKNLGILWKAPFAVDITDAARKGTNWLEIKVTNLWPNRLTGDQFLPADKRITWTTYNPYKKESPLLPSGLIGPVQVKCADVIDLNSK